MPKTKATSHLPFSHGIDTHIIENNKKTPTPLKINLEAIKEKGNQSSLLFPAYKLMGP
ncbi:hypothetical protein [Syntrophothermus lipocalidus]|uniref:hypothetical protein n=1 Tax=Syntrophothermus lipocalidus TaxID=86170 RepID=UPI00145D3ECE|nr:hypothetical protein [Syntrophothermus lipocalidus]